MFVFGVVFKIRWGVEHGSQVQFGIILFSGLIVHALFSECLIRAPGLVLANPQFVKKVVFPLEVLPVVSTGTALFHFAVGLVILVLANAAFDHAIHTTMLLSVVVIAPMVVLSLGVSWLLAALGVFIRDLRHIVGILATVLLFLSPVFYPVSSVPQAVRPLIYLNPITVIVEELRNTVLFGTAPNWLHLAVYTIVALLFTGAGYFVFVRSRRAFADVV